GGGQPLLLSFVGDAYRFRGHRDRIVVDQCVPVFQCALVTVSHVGVEGSGKGHVVLGNVVLSRRGAPARVDRRGVHQTHVALPEVTHHFTVVQDAQPRDGEQDPQVSFLASPLGQGSQEFVQVGGPSGEEDGVVVRGTHVEGHAAEQTCLRGIPQRGADVLLGVPGGEPAEVLFVGPTQRGDEQVGVVVVVDERRAGFLLQAVHVGTQGSHVLGVAGGGSQQTGDLPVLESVGGHGGGDHGHVRRAEAFGDLPGGLDADAHAGDRDQGCLRVLRHRQEVVHDLFPLFLLTADVGQNQPDLWCGITEVVRVVSPHLGGVGPFQGPLHPDRVHRTHLTERERAQEGDGDDVSTGHTLVLLGDEVLYLGVGLVEDVVRVGDPHTLAADR